MSKITLKQFQNTAVESLQKEFLDRLVKPGKQEIKFEAPTGAGKTIMMAEFVKSLVLKESKLEDTDLCFLWVSIGGSKDDSLVEQSKNKFIKYYGGANGIKISTLEDIKSNKVLERNEIMFFNWAKIISRNKDDRKLRRQNEWEISWDKMLQETKKNKNRKIILLIDEAHRQKDTILSDEEIKLIDPKIEIHITATHKDNKSIDVKVSQSDVIDAGIIKLYIESQTEEDILNEKNKDLDETILSLALNKKRELDDLYRENNIAVNPLLLIQLPHDTKLEEDETKKDLILSLLNKYKIEKSKVAIWLSGEKKIGDIHMKDLSSITNNQSDVDILIFKDAVATGWDCPRAQILVMYREINNPVFTAQLLGRILRTSEGKRYNIQELDIAYLYTNYNKKDIVKGYDNYQGPNMTKIFESKIKKEIKEIKGIELETFKSQRVDYNDIGKSFQKTFLQVARKKYKNLEALKKDGFELITPSDNVLANVQIKNYDDFITGGIDDGIDIVADSSRLDIEKMYRKLCKDILLKQSQDSKYGNIARSYGKIKGSLNVWFEELGFKNKNGKDGYYNYIVNDFIKMENGHSVLLSLINDALQDYKPARDEELKEKAKKKGDEEIHKIKIPKEEEGWNSNYKIVSDFKKCVYEECFIREDKINDKSTGEYAFINYLEADKNVEWWWKNGDMGAEYFSVKKEDGHLFFPDFFIKTKEHIYIIDTKGEITLNLPDAKMKIVALNKWQKENKDHKEKFLVYFAKLENGLWKWSNDDKLNKWENINFE